MLKLGFKPKVTRKIFAAKLMISSPIPLLNLDS